MVNLFFYLTILGTIQFLSNIIGLIFIQIKYQIKIFLPTINDIILHLKNSFNLFFFRLTVSLYTSSNSLIVGLITNTSLTGLYAGSEKIIRAFAGIWAPLNSVLFAKMSELTSKNFNYAKKIFKLILVTYMILGLILSLILFIGAKKITILILGENFIDAIMIIKIQCFIIFLIAGSNALGLLWLVPLRKDKEFNKIISVAGLINIILGIILTYSFSIYGMAFSVLIVELFVTLSCFYTILKNREIKFV